MVAPDISSSQRSGFESEVFELTAQSGERRIFVHGDILASQSEPFRKIVTGHWRESTERKIDLTDWDGDTVTRFVDFLYTGNYRYPDPKPITHGENPDPGRISPFPLSFDLDTSLGTPEDRSSSAPYRPLTPFDRCLSRVWLHEKEDGLTDAKRLELYEPARYNYKEVLLVHAKVYVLAQYKDVDVLRKLALKRLFLTLLRIKSIQPGSHEAGNIIDLLSYVYSETDALESSEEPLRKIVSQFAALNILALQAENKMAKLIGDGGDIATDLMAKVCRRLSIVEMNPNNIQFVSNVLVTRGSAPPDSLQELIGLSNDLNAGVTDCSKVSLVPLYTFDPRDACTSFQVLVGTSKPVGVANFIAENPYRCIVPTKRQDEKKKITELKLLRAAQSGVSLSNINSLESGGFDGMTSDINSGRGKDYLYLLWKSVDVS